MSDEQLRRLLRAARAGDQDARRALEREKRRRGLPSRAGALKLWKRAQDIAVIEIDDSWVALLQPHAYQDSVDLQSTSTARWRDETILAGLYRGSDATYVRIERHLSERFEHDVDSDVSGDVYLYEIHDGAVVRHPPIRYGGEIVRPARRSVIRVIHYYPEWLCEHCGTLFRTNAPGRCSCGAPIDEEERVARLDHEWQPVGGRVCELCTPENQVRQLRGGPA